MGRFVWIQIFFGGHLTSKFFGLIFYVYLRNDKLNDFRFYLYYVAI